MIFILKLTILKGTFSAVWYIDSVIKPPYDPEIPLLRICPEETKIEKGTCNKLFIAALFTIARTWKQCRCPSTDEWIKKLWYRCTMEYYSAIKGTDLSQF